LKTCNTCRETKDFTEFGKRRESKDGHAPRCTLCVKARRKKLATGEVISKFGPELEPEQRRHVYMSAIIRMRQQGLVSHKTTTEMLERIGEL